MNLRPAHVVLYLTAALAGWGGVSWLDNSPETSVSVTASSPPASIPRAGIAATLRPLSAGSKSIAGLPSMVAALPSGPDSDWGEAYRTLGKWPPGIMKDFAEGLINERLAKAADPFYDSPAPPEKSAEPPYNRFRELSESMQTGFILYGPGTTGGCWNDYSTLSDWVAMDPVLATAALLAMPAGDCRSTGVDVAADTLARTDPAAALDLVLKSQEQHPGTGAANALTKLLPEGGGSDAAEPFLKSMNRTQRDSLLASTAEMMQSRDVSNPLPDGQMMLLAFCAFRERDSSPGFEAFFEELTKYPQAAHDVRQHLGLLETLTPAQQRAAQILAAGYARELVPDGGMEGVLAALDDFQSSPARQAAMDYMGPSVIPQLARAGHFTEALHLLDSVQSPDARRTAVEALLPMWMDKDPDAARAAFDTIPLTALDRDRWEHHPAFLRARGP